VKAIKKATSDIQGQYKKALTQRTQQIIAATAGEFLKALKYHPDVDANKVRGVQEWHPCQ